MNNIDVKEYKDIDSVLNPNMDEVIEKEKEKIKEEIMVLSSQRDPNYLDICKKIMIFYKIYYDDKMNIFWLWNGKKWEMTSESRLLRIFLDMSRWADNVKTGKKNQIITAFKVLGLSIELKEPPRNWISIEDGIYDINTQEVLRHDWQYFFKNHIKWSLGSSDETPIIDGLLESWVGEKKVLLYELMAYSLYRDYPIQRLIFLLGNGGNGKGSFLRLFEKFIGEENKATFNLQQLYSNFHPAKLFNKLIAITTETNYGMLNNTAILKQLTGGDSLHLEFKNKNPSDFKNYAKIIISTNSLPATTDKTRAWYRRALVIDFPNEFEEHKEVSEDVPDYEFENLLLKLLRLLPSVIDKGLSFDTDVKTKEKIYEDRSNPVKKFIDAYCDESFNDFVQATEFMQKYKQWCVDNKIRVLDTKKIWYLLISLGLDKDRKRLDYELNPVSVILGIKWR